MDNLGNEKGGNNENIFFCDYCDHICSNKYNYDRHILTARHRQNSQGNKKGGNNFHCAKCNLKCSDQYKWNRHLLTAKHAKNVEETKKGGTNEYTCQICHKTYQTRTGLWKHRKTCDKEGHSQQSFSDQQMMMMILKQNSDFFKENCHLSKVNSELIQNFQDNIKEIVLEIMKNGTHINNNNNNQTINNINSNNKSFNLNFFLNETCKNAMNISEFAESISLQLSDFLEVGKLGYVQGISNIIVKKLNDLDETIRPIHCMDQKRETFYVKDENKWEKEDTDNKKIRKLIKTVSFKNEKLMKTYKEIYPDYNDSSSKRSDEYSKTVIEAMGGNVEQHQKIIKNISKVTTVEKKIRE